MLFASFIISRRTLKKINQSIYLCQQTNYLQNITSLVIRKLVKSNLWSATNSNIDSCLPETFTYIKWFFLICVESFNNILSSKFSHFHKMISLWITNLASVK